MASPIASPQNIIALDQMKPPPSWPEWFIITLPCCFIIDLLIWGLLLLIYNPAPAIPNPQHTIEPPQLFRRKSTKRKRKSVMRLFGDEAGDDEPLLPSVDRYYEGTDDEGTDDEGTVIGWNLTQWFIMFVTFLTIGLWCIESQIESIVGDMGVIAIIPMVLFFGINAFFSLI